MAGRAQIENGSNRNKRTKEGTLGGRAAGDSTLDVEGGKTYSYEKKG